LVLSQLALILSKITLPMSDRWRKIAITLIDPVTGVLSVIAWFRQLRIAVELWRKE
jgi:hypothetical protein